ncbi:AAA family ATPase [Thiovibrio frasassiensis]|uniref:AAA family ATPase n=1 Tax=Thiovibrio frasassiensis TaxID=2984131 RepID=A0A9X4MFQ7_9BACT|nr:AAA family ATPase [Thiovibrio frasassiensis]MDG4476431.1 AAA family ATPase [Thiovibrio frasassiensis]
MSEYDATLPDQKELEKEIGEYLSKKYGQKVKIISSGLLPMSQSEESDSGKPSKAGAADFHFDTNPEELIAYLDEYVVRQDEAKAILATKICTHFNRISYALAKPRQARRSMGQIKSNVLLMGPTGVGKTFLIKLIARHLGVPFIKGDATKFSETGYVGGDVEDLVRDLVREADGDIDRAQFGIIYLDEIDKIASSPYRIGADVSRTGVQRALLKPMEETEVELKVPHDPVSQIEAIEQYRATGKRERQVVNTKNILFITSGAFAGLEDIIKKRVQQQSMGFESSVSSVKTGGRFLKQVKAEDLVEFGFESEFVGRLPVIAVLDELSEDDFYEILANPNSSIVVAKKQDFRVYGISLQFEEEALHELARLAKQERTGARGLVSVMEKVLLHYEKKLPSTSIRHLVVGVEMVHSPAAVLERLLRDEGVQAEHRTRFEALQAAEFERLTAFILKRMGSYLEDHQVLTTPTRLQLMAKESQDQDVDPREVCDTFIRFVQAIHDSEMEISEKCGVKVLFSEEAVDRLLTREPRTLEAIQAACAQILQAMEYGLRLMGQKKGVAQVVVPKEGVDAPERYINTLVGETFKVE